MYFAMALGGGHVFYYGIRWGHVFAMALGGGHVFCYGIRWGSCILLWH